MLTDPKRCINSNFVFNNRTSDSKSYYCLRDLRIPVIFCNSGGGFEAMRVSSRTVQSGKTT
jgi:hypothetical protein